MPLASVTDPSEIGRLPRLTNLALAGLALNSISFVSSCLELRDLSLQRIPISNLDALSGMKNLQRVSLVDIPIIEITPLLNAPSLRELTVMRTPARADILAELERRRVKVSNP
jgi:Leucine-rich repeat (LRR) protein